MNTFVKNIVYIIILLWSNLLLAQEDFSKDKTIPDQPNPPKLVNDFANIFQSNQVADLEQNLVAFNDTTSTQIAVVTVENLNGYGEDEFGFRLARKWGIGQKGKNNGILILIAKEERAIDIELGYGIESYVSDGDAKYIIDNIMIPEFKNGNYFAGVQAATTTLMKMLQGTYQRESTNSTYESSDSSHLTFIIIFILLFIIIAIIASKGKGGNGNYTGGSGGWTWNTGGSSWGSGSTWSGGGGSSGGFGGFGGGSFGGGGASGRW